jgi:hypothetical protein
MKDSSLHIQQAEKEGENTGRRNVYKLWEIVLGRREKMGAQNMRPKPVPKYWYRSRTSVLSRVIRSSMRLHEAAMPL